ncbi:MAG: TonB-dependent receptor [Chitinispirillaceae bacterium]|nr:TonB-dependent receptor [Chitinispirillaceae bacterium]
MRIRRGTRINDTDAGAAAATVTRKRVFAAAVVCWIAGSAVPVRAGKIAGTVRNAQTGRALQGVLVEIETSGRTAFSDSTGAFRFDSLAPGSCNLFFFHEHMEPLRINDVFIAGSAEKRLDVDMNPQLASLDTMKVRGSAFRKDPDMASSAKTMSFDEILRQPGALVDVQRAVQNLPSVSSAGDNTNEIIVRGGNRGENLVVMDNIEIPNPNHFADQGSGGGVVSLINPLLVKGLTFSAGAPPAQYGGKASSVLDVRLRDGNDAMVLGGIDIGMAGAGFHIEGPLWREATFMASATKSYLNLFAHFSDSAPIPAYWGGQAKVAQKLGRHKVSVNCIGGANEIFIEHAAKIAGTDGDHVEAGGIIYATGLNWEALWNDRLSMITTVSATGNSFNRLEYSDTTSEGADTPDTFFVNSSLEQEQMLKSVVSLDIGEKNRISAGGSAKRCDFNEKIMERRLSTDDQRMDTTATSYGGLGYRYAGFISAILYPMERLKVIPGVRCDYFTFNKSFTVAPRLGLVYSFSPSIDLTASGGLQHQEPDYAQLAADKQNRSLKAKRVATGIAGMEYTLERYASRFVVEAFYKKFNDTPVPYALTTDGLFDRSDIYLSIGRGRSYGVEFFAHKKLTDHFFGSAAYSLSRSWQDDPRAGHEGDLLRGDFDFRNIVTVTGGCKVDLINEEWYKRVHRHWWMIAASPVMPIADRMELSAKWRYLGGRPRTVNIDEAGNELGDRGYLAAEYPAYHRLDIRFERRYGFGFLQMIYYFDFQNIYNRENIWMYIYSKRRRRETPIPQFAFFPAGGVIIGF